VVAYGESLQIPQVLAAAKDSEYGHRQQVPNRKAQAAAHPSAWDLPEVADQVEIGCSKGALQQKVGAIQLTSTHADSTDKRACVGL